MPRIDTDTFSHIRRMTDNRFPTEVACILPGEFFVSREPMVVYTVLGSCISACIRDPIAGVGGMNHFMLPSPKEHRSGDAWGGESTRYGSFAMEQMINEILKRGGGRIYDGNIDVGARNAEWVLRYIETEGYPLAKSDLGDVFPRKVYYFTDSGRVLMKRLERLKNRTIVDRETEYQHRIEVEPVAEKHNVTLF
jgi:chemotaxis protein CheD